MNDEQLSKRDKAYAQVVNDARKNINKIITSAMTRRDVSCSELDALVNCKAGRMKDFLNKPPVTTIAKIMFELGYEVHFTAIPISKERLKEAASTFEFETGT